MNPDSLDSHADDAVLHAGIIAGQSRALEIWDQRYRTRMIAAGVRDGLSLVDAETAWYSDVLATVWDRAPSIEPIGSGLMRYAFGIMRMQARSARRQESQHPVSLDAMSNLRSPAPTPMPSPRRRAVVECMQRLSARDRVLVEAVYLEMVDASVIAEQAGIQPRSVQRAAERACQKIKQCLEEALNV